MAIWNSGDSFRGTFFDLRNSAPPIESPPQLMNLSAQSQQVPNQLPIWMQSSPINPLAVETQRNLLNLKNQYDDAEKAINVYNGILQTGTDEHKRNAQANIDYYRARQGELSKAANQQREVARNLGIDTTGFNAENTLEESQQLMRTNNARAMQGLMNMPTLQAQLRQYQDDLVSVGLSKRLARKAAAQYAGELRQQRAQELMTGLQTYGINGDGSMNQFGVGLLQKLAQEDPTGATLMFNAMAMPKNMYDNAQQNYRSLLQLQNQSEINEANNRRAEEIAREQIEAQNARDAARNQLEVEKYNTKNQLEIEKFNREQEYKYQELQLKQQKFYADLSDNPTLKGHNEAIKFLANTFGTIEDSILSGDVEGAGSMLEKLDEYISDPINFKENRYLTPEETLYYQRIGRVCKDYLEKKDGMTLDQFQSEILRIKDPEEWQRKKRLMRGHGGGRENNGDNATPNKNPENTGTPNVTMHQTPNGLWAGYNEDTNFNPYGTWGGQDWRTGYFGR